MRIYCGICDSEMLVAWDAHVSVLWRCPDCDHEVTIPHDNPNGWIQPVAADCPLDGHSHEPGQLCRGCADLTGWTPPIFALEPPPTYIEHRRVCKSCSDVDSFRGSQRCSEGQRLLKIQGRVSRNIRRRPILDKNGRRFHIPIDYGTFEENLTKGDEQFLESLKVSWK